ncbi:MAG: hypothetical protein ACE5Q6_08580 [Dehalococcoidia bacterium]
MTQESQETQSENPLAGVKVVLNILDEGVLIGVSRGAVDPHMENCAISPDDDIQAILAVIPEVLERARERWEGQPRFPAYQAPAAATGTQRAGQQTGRGRGRGNQQQGDAEAPRMF